MSGSLGMPRKRRIVAIALLCFALWPLAQHGLVRAFGVDPWKLFGWAMYSAPGPMRTVRVVGVLEDGTALGLDYRAYAPADERAISHFRHRRNALGSLASSDRLALSLLAGHPEWAGVWIGVLSLSLDADSARLMHDVQQRVHWRSGEGPELRYPDEIFAQ